MAALFQDLRYAMRQLWKTPGLTIAAVVMVAFGIGVNTALFAVFYQVLLRTLPVRKPSELVLLKESSKYETGGLDMWGGDPGTYFAYPAFQALRDGNRSLEDLAAATVTPATIVSDKNTDKSLIQWVSGSYFNLLGLQPVLGRLLVPADDVYHAGRPVAVINENYWRSHFGADRFILNQQVQVNGSQFTIVGVVQHAGIIDSAPVAVFAPISHGPAPGQPDLLSDPLHRELNIIGRLRPEMSREHALAQLNAVWWNWRREITETRKHEISDEKGWLATHLSLVSAERGIPLLQQDLGEPVAILEIMAFLALLIACANVAGLLLAKSISRTREFAMHFALGGNRAQLVRKVACEGLLLGIIGIALGLLLGSLALKILIGTLPVLTGLRESLTAQMHWSTLAICASAGLGASFAFSIVPALFSSRVNVLSAIQPHADSRPGRGARLRSILVAAEISLSVVLLSAAAVFGWTLHTLRSVNPGYDTSRHMLTFRVDASVLGKSDATVRNEYAEITEAIRHQPGVRSIAYAADGLIDNSEMGSNIMVAGYSEQPDELTPDDNWVTPNFFSTMGIPLVAGRVFTDTDTAASPKVAIVDESFVRHYFGGDAEKALKGRFSFGASNHPKFDYEIVGVIPTIRATNLGAPPSVPFIFLPYDQTYSTTQPDPRTHPASFYVNTSGDTTALASRIRSLVHSIDRNLPVTRLETMEDHVNDITFEMRAASTLSSAMGGLALALVAIGLYGLLAFVVTQHTREIGLRMAFGANRQHIAGLIVTRLAGLVSAGLSVGILLSWMSVHALASRDSNLAHTPMWLFSGGTVLLVLVMLAAAAAPAHRAAKVDPMVALRYE